MRTSFFSVCLGLLLGGCVGRKPPPESDIYFLFEPFGTTATPSTSSASIRPVGADPKLHIVPYAASASPRAPRRDPRRAAADLDVREATFRDLLRQAREGEVCFIAFQIRPDTLMDPPDDFLRRLEDTRLPLRKVSDAAYGIFRGDEVSSREDHVRDRVTHQAGSVYYVGITRWTSGDKVGINAGRFGSPQDARGYYTKAAMKEGKWVVDKSPGGQFSEWVP